MAYENRMGGEKKAELKNGQNPSTNSETSLFFYPEQ